MIVATRSNRGRAQRDATPRSVDDRWTPKLAQGGWTPVPDYFLRNYHRLKITHNEAMVIIHLMQYKWDEQAPFPSLGTIAKQMRLTPSTVRNHLRSLQKRSYVFREQIDGSTNRFYLNGLFKALEAMMDADKAVPSADPFGPTVGVL